MNKKERIKRIITGMITRDIMVNGLQDYTRYQEREPYHALQNVRYRNVGVTSSKATDSNQSSCFLFIPSCNVLTENNKQKPFLAKQYTTGSGKLLQIPNEKRFIMEKIIHLHNGQFDIVENQAIINTLKQQGGDLKKSYGVRKALHMQMDVNFESADNIPKHARHTETVHLYSHPESKDVTISIPSYEQDEAIHEAMVQHVIISLLPVEDVTHNTSETVHILSKMASYDDNQMFIARYFECHPYNLDVTKSNDVSYTFDTHTNGLLWLFMALTNATFVLFRVYEAVIEQHSGKLNDIPNDPKDLYDALPTTVAPIVSDIRAIENHDIVTYDDLVLLDRIITDASVSHTITFMPSIDMDRVPLTEAGRLYDQLITLKLDDARKADILENWKQHQPNADTSDTCHMLLVAVEPRLQRKSDFAHYDTLSFLYDEQLKPSIAEYHHQQERSIGFRVHYVVGHTLYSVDVLLLPEIKHVVHSEVPNEHLAIHQLIQDVLPILLHDDTERLFEILHTVPEDDDKEMLNDYILRHQFCESFATAKHVYVQNDTSDMEKRMEQTKIEINMKLLRETFTRIVDIYKIPHSMCVNNENLREEHYIHMQKDIYDNLIIYQEMHDTPHTTSVERFQFAKRLMENELRLAES